MKSQRILSESLPDTAFQLSQQFPVGRHSVRFQNVGYEKISDGPVITEPRNFILATELSLGAHVVSEGIAAQGSDDEWLQDFSRDEVVVVDILQAQAAVDLGGKSGEV